MEECGADFCADINWALQKLSIIKVFLPNEKNQKDLIKVINPDDGSQMIGFDGFV